MSYFSLEGLVGSGKSSVLKILASFLKKEKKPFSVVSEPRLSFHKVSRRRVQSFGGNAERSHKKHSHRSNAYINSEQRLLFSCFVHRFFIFNSFQSEHLFLLCFHRLLFP